MNKNLQDKLIEMYKEHGRGMFNILKSKDNIDIYNQIFEETKKFEIIKDITFATRCYLIYYGYDELPICKNKDCTNHIEQNIKSFTRGFYDFCSVKCAANDKDRIQRIYDTKEERYGDPHYNNYEQTKITNKERYGVEHTFQTDHNKELAKQTKLEKYGDPNFTNQQKREETNLERYGCTNPLCNEQVKEKRDNKMIEKYGVKYTLQSEELKEKYYQTKEEKYGSRTYTNVKKIKETKKERYGDENYTNIEKYKKTCLERYGVDSYTKTDECKEKIRNTCNDKYGVDCYFQTEDCKERAKYANIENFGVEYAVCCDDVNKKSLEIRLRSFYDKIISNQYVKLLCDFDTFKHKTDDTIFKWKCLECGYEFESEIDPNWGFFSKIKAYGRCPKCYPKNRVHSNSEIEVLDYVKEIYTGNILNGKNTRKIIPPQELDIYIPELKLGIEFDGLFWHSEYMGKDSNYHIRKTEMCENKDIKLIHIFSDEWERDRKYIQKIIKNNILTYKSYNECVTQILFDDYCNFCKDNDYMINHTIENKFYGSFNEKSLECIYVVKICDNRINVTDKIEKFDSEYKTNDENFVNYIKKENNEIHFILDRRFYSSKDVKGKYETIKPSFKYIFFNINERFNEEEKINEKNINKSSKVWDCGYFDVKM